MKVRVVKKILADNQRQADLNRSKLAASATLCVNLMSGPGAGKTCILEKTIPILKDSFGLKAAVVEGDVEGDLDGARLDKLGVPVVQLNTSGACHLDATMVDKALIELPLQESDLLFIENVGNLVCPTGFDLGEDLRAVVLSVPEGDDKPVKYPGMFKKATVLLINKMDLSPYLEFSVERVSEVCRRLNPQLKIFQVSARTGEGIQKWAEFLVEQQRLKAKNLESRGSKPDSAKKP